MIAVHSHIQNKDPSATEIETTDLDRSWVALKKAIDDVLHIKDANEFLGKSGYAKKI